jgi:hypothetical protein
MTMNPSEFSSIWSDKFPETWPRAESLKTLYGDRWVRIYSLPNAKRYPETEEERQQVLSRYSSVLTELSSSGNILVITCEWDNNPTPKEGTSSATGDSSNKQYWESFKENPDETSAESVSYRHLYIQEAMVQDTWLRELLLKVAEDEIAGVIIVSPNMDWIFHPYDGGMDVILKSRAERDSFAEKHKEWTE